MTVQELLNIAYGKSKKNTPGVIIAESTEGVALVNRVLRTFVQIGVRVNPTFFVVSEVVSYNDQESVGGIGWIRPADAESVLQIMMTVESEEVEVSVVPFNDRGGEVGKPAVYRLGQTYIPCGNPLDPTATDDLTFFYSKRPTDATALADDLDPLWPEAYSELAALEIAAYMAHKDGRDAELALLAADRDAWLSMYIAFLEHETMNEVRRWDLRFNVPSAMPISLIGGTTVRMPGGAA